MSRKVVVGVVVLMLAGLGLPAQAYHIAGDDGTGSNVDPVTGLHSDQWLVTGVNQLPGEVGDQDADDLFGVGGAGGGHGPAKMCTNVLGDQGLRLVDCRTTVNDYLPTRSEPFMCENDATSLRPAKAGYGGRCFSSLHVGKPATAPEDGRWVRMDVTADVSSTCNLEWRLSGAKYFARIINNVHGAKVESGESFFYRENLAYWGSDGHVWYVPDPFDATVGGGSAVACFGGDTHLQDNTVAWAAHALCNSQDSDDNVDPFDRGSYVVGAPGDEQTVCVA